MDCCRGAPCEQMFKPRVARRSLKHYRANGLDRIEQGMVDAAVAGGLEDARVLEIGGGIGTIEIELLEAGAATGEIVELVPAYEPYARELAQEKGLAERTTFRVVDLLDDPDAVEPADVVVLNRVVCCSPDGVGLSSAAARLAQRTLVLSYPRAVWWTRFAVGALNVGIWTLRRSFRVFVHEPASIARAIEAAGLRMTGRGTSFFWEYAAFQRPS